MALKGLETDIGGGLFLSDRKTQLTPLGQYVLARARNDLAQFDATVRGIRDQVQHQGRNLRIGAVPSVMVRLMPDWVSTFRQRHPDVHLELRDMDSLALQSALETDHLDLVIRSHMTPVPDALTTDPLGWVLPADHELSQYSELGWDDCKTQPLLSNRLCQASPSEWLNQMDQEASMRIHNTASLLAMVQSGQGLTVLPRMAIQAYEPVRFVTCAEGDVRYLKIHSNPRTPPLAEAFMEHISSSF